MGSVDFRCDLRGKAEALPHFWEHTVGSCHAPLALRADWQAQLRRCRVELGFRHLRFHGLLDDDMSTLVRCRDRFASSFYNADRIWDFLRSIGMRPFIELSFMPTALASGSATVFHYRGNITPPRNYDLWAALIRELAGHWVERYGIDEVRQWFFEVWNEPNLEEFWTGSREEYFRLYRASAEALKGVDGGLRVGGPATAKNAWIEEFLDFCAAEQVPADFVSTHQYPNDVLWREGQDTAAQLANSRRGILREWAEEAKRQARGRPLYYTEWNCSSNLHYPPQDESYAAAFVVKTVLEMTGLVECYSFWTFSDLFEEEYLSSVPFHGGFGLLNLQGVPKPSYRAFELLHRLGTERLTVEGRHPTVDAWVVRQTSGVTVLLTNHALPRHPVEIEEVSIALGGAPPPRAAVIERIDADHANPKRRWQQMGEPKYLSRGQLEELERASCLVKEAQAWRWEAGTIYLDVTLPAHGVAAVTVE